MVIVNVKAGRLANRLIHFSHFIANSIEYDYKLIYPHFREYLELFDPANSATFNQYNISIKFTRNKGIDRILILFFRIVGLLVPRHHRRIPFIAFHDLREMDRLEQKFDLNTPEFITMAKNKLTFVNGWGYRDNSSFQKFSSEIRCFFKPREPFRDQIADVIRSCRQKGNVIVGMHIRRGDYDTFFDGKWFFDDDVYAKKMGEMENLMSLCDKHCVFLLCSDESIERSNFSGFDIVAENRPAIVDLYALSECDYIIGPPSTFTLWASFFGNVPLFILTRPELNLYLHNFRIIKNC